MLTSAILEFETGIASFTCSTRTESDQRVHVYGDAGRISVSIPFNIPPDRPTTISLIAGGDPPVAPATDTLNGDEGDDRILVRDGQHDVVNCGPGFDRVIADTTDAVAADCEVVRMPTRARG